MSGVGTWSQLIWIAASVIKEAIYEIDQNQRILNPQNWRNSWLVVLWNHYHKFRLKFELYVFRIRAEWPTRGPKINFCGPISNWNLVIFRYFGPKWQNFGQFFQMRPKDQFGLVTPEFGTEILEVLFWD
jgi:hypothetical protein